jgi:ABC-type branched-subunit amino acid transport system ATPase component
MHTSEVENILEVKEVTAGYTEDSDIISHVTLTVRQGQIVCMIGPNGAGKSTLFKAIFGTLRAKSGEIIFNGIDVAKEDHRQRIRRGLVYCPQGQNVFPKMTVHENMEMGAFIRTDKNVSRDILSIYKRFPILEEKREALVGNLSGGQQQILEMARTLLLHPKLILLDEPSMGLAPLFRDHVFKEVATINAGGEAILMIEQNAKKALAFSEYAYVLERGRIKYHGPSKEILKDPKIKELYLGGDAFNE